MAIKLNKIAIAGVACSAIFAGFSAPAFADTSSVIDKLYELGVLNDEAYAELSKEAKDERREAAEKSAEDSDPNKISCKYSDGFKCKSKDGQFGMQIAGRIQQDYREYDTTQDSAFDVRRLYLGVKGHVYGDWKYELTQNIDESAGTDNKGLEYAFVEYAGNPNAHVRIGSQKFHYSFEEITSSRFTDFAERSVVNKMVVGKDRGVNIFGAPIKNQFMYSFGYANGNGRADDDNNGKLWTARLAYNATGDKGKKRGTIAHFDIAYAQGNEPSGNVADVDGEAKSSTKIWTTSGDTASFNKKLSNVGAVLISGPWKLQTEYNKYGAEWSATERTIKTNYAAISWLITGERYADGYSLGGMKAIEPNTVFGSSGGTGAWELGIRRSNVDVSQNMGGSGTNKADSTTVGLKWIPNHKVRFILNHVHTSYDEAISSRTSESAWILRSQLDF